MLINNNDYFQALENVKAAIQSAQYRAVLGVNREQILLFWNIGKVIIDNSRYGSGFIENLARDIKRDFPDVKGYSVRNLRYMRKFAEMFDDIENLQAPLADLTWYALRDINKPIGVSEYRLSDFVPQELADTLPSAEDIERRIKSKYDIKDDGEGD